MKILKILFVYLITLLGLICLFQDSIAIYWQQTYHKSLPVDLSKIAFLDKINLHHQHLQEVLIKKTAELKDKNDRIYIKTNQILQNVFHEELVKQKEATSDFLASQHIKPTPKGLNLAYVTLVELSYQTKVKFDMSANQPKSNQHEDNTELDVNQADSDNQNAKISLNVKDKILFVGDSLMQGVAPRVKRALYQQFQIESIDISKQSTGLTYSNMFDWPLTIEETLKKASKIKLLVVFLGPNDPWSYRIKQQRGYIMFKSKQWEDNYRAKIRRILNASSRNHVDVIWLGAPCMKNSELHQNMMYLNSLYQSEVLNQNQHYVSTNELLGCYNEKYAHSVITKNGNIKMRINDGIHFTVPGQKVIAEKVISMIDVSPK